MATRLFLRQSQTEPTTGGTVYDLGTTAATGTLAVSGTASVLTEFARWVRALPITELPLSGSVSIPYEISIASQSSTTESRIVVARLNSSGTVQQRFDGATYTGTGATTLSGTATLSGFALGDLVAVIVENRRTSGGGSRTTTINTTSDSFVDVPKVPAGQGANLSATSSTGAAEGEHPLPVPEGVGENLSVTATAGNATGQQPPPPPAWVPEPVVTIDGVDFTGQTVNRVRVSRGRRTVYERPNAGYASIELRDVGDMPELQVGRIVRVTVADSDGDRVTMFTGTLSDWNAQTVSTGAEPVVFYSLQAVGPLAKLNRRQVATGGRPSELDGARVAAALGGLGQTWEEAPFDLSWEDATGSWEDFGSEQIGLIDPGVFDLAALDPADGGYNALQVAQDAGFSGEGVLFETADGLVGYADADRRDQNERDGFFVIPASQLDVRGLTVSQQLADITNRVNVEYDGGAVSRQDNFSIVEYGVYETGISTILVDAGNATVRAENFLARHASPVRVLEELPFNLVGVTSLIRDVLLTVNSNDAIEVSGIPSRLGFTRFQGFVEGLTFEVDRFSAGLTLTVSDKRLSVGSERWGQVDATIRWQDVDATLVWQDATKVTV